MSGATTRGTFTIALLLGRIDVSEDGCWLWTGAVTTDRGYARYGEAYQLHRWAYEHFVGPIPDGLVIDHRCHNPRTCRGGPSCPHRRCMNPDHMLPVTSAENLLIDRRTPGVPMTVCQLGHPLTDENTIIETHSGRTQRRCRECRRYRWRQNNAKRRSTRLSVVR